MQAVGVGLVGDLVARADTARQGALLVAVVDVVDLGLEVDQRVVRRVAVVQRQVLRPDAVAAEFVPEVGLLDVHHVGVGVVDVGHQVAELQALVVWQVEAEFDQA